MKVLLPSLSLGSVQIAKENSCQQLDKLLHTSLSPGHGSTQGPGALTMSNFTWNAAGRGRWWWSTSFRSHGPVLNMPPLFETFSSAQLTGVKAADLQGVCKSAMIFATPPSSSLQETSMLSPVRAPRWPPASSISGWLALASRHTHCKSCSVPFLMLPNAWFVLGSQTLHWLCRDCMLCSQCPPACPALHGLLFWLLPIPRGGTRHLWPWADVRGPLGRTGTGLSWCLSPHPSRLLPPYKHCVL